MILYKCNHLGNGVFNVLSSPDKIWNSFTILFPCLWINHILLNENLDNNFQILEHYAKTEMVGEFDTYKDFFKMTSLLMWSIPYSCNRSYRLTLNYVTAGRNNLTYIVVLPYCILNDSVAWNGSTVKNIFSQLPYKKMSYEEENNDAYCLPEERNPLFWWPHF